MFIKAYAAKVSAGGGVWRTINGSPVFIQGGKITKGPARLVGSNASDVEKSSKSTAEKKEELKKKYGDKVAEKKVEDTKSSTAKPVQKKDDTAPKTNPNKNGTVSYNGKEYSYEVKGNHVITRAPSGAIISDQYIADRHLGNVKSFVQSSFGAPAKTSNLSSKQLVAETRDLMEGMRRGDSTAQRQASYYFRELANRNLNSNGTTKKK